MGHEGQLPLSRLIGCSQFRQVTFAGTHGNGQDAPIPPVRLTTTGRLKSTLSCPSRARQRRVERRPSAAGFEVIRGKGVPSNTDTNANNRRLNGALEPVSGAAARALRDSTRRGFIRRDAHFPGMPYSRDSAATRSENCGVK